MLIHPRRLDAILLALRLRMSLASLVDDDNDDVPATSRPSVTADGAVVIRVHRILAKRAFALETELDVTSYQSIRSGSTRRCGTGLAGRSSSTSIPLAEKPTAYLICVRI